MAKSKKTTKTTKVAKTKVEEPIEAPAPIKRKKRHIGLKILIVFLTIFVVFPVAFFFGAIFDTSTKQNLPSSPVSYENTISQTIRDGMKNTETTGELGLYLDDYALDGMMLYACNELTTKFNIQNYIPRMYCEISGNNYNFFVEMQALNFFKTRVKIETELTKENDQLVFRVKGLVIGRLPIPLNWITGILGNFITDETINNAFASTGLHFNCEFSKLQLTYKREKFKEDIGVLLGEFAGNNPFINVLLELFGEDEVLTTKYEDGVKVSFDLKPLASNDTYKKERFLKFKDLDEHKAKIAKWLKEGLVTEATAPQVFNFLIRGWENTKEENHSLITGNLNLKNAVEEYVDAVANEYKGSEIECPAVGDANRFADVCVALGDITTKATILDENGFINAVTEAFGEDEPTPDTDYNLNIDTIFSLKDSVMSGVLASLQDILGMTILVTSENNDKSWNVDYICIDNLYCELENQQMNFYISLNVNGYPTTIIIPTIVPSAVTPITGESTIGNLVFDLIDRDDGAYKIFFGELDMPKAIQSTLFDTLAIANEWIEFDPSAGEFVFKLDKVVPTEGRIHSIIANLAKGEINCTITLPPSVSVNLEGTFVPNISTENGALLLNGGGTFKITF